MSSNSSEPMKVVCGKCHGKYDVSDLEPFSAFQCPECGTKLRVPRRFERYILEKPCGRGGMSNIYRAFDPVLARRVVVKVLTPGGDSEEEFTARFLNEASLISKLDHPGLVPIYNCGVWEHQPFLVMRYMEHGDLERLQREGRLPAIPVIAGWLANVAAGLEHAAAAGIAHHDVKPSNILLTADNCAKLGDFDLADLGDPGTGERKMLEWGSSGYMSPERILDGVEDSRGDIFSLGATIYELFSGVTPFGMGEDLQLLYDRRAKMDMEPLCRRNCQVPEDFSRLVGRMLSFDPLDRPGYPEVIAGLRRLSELKVPEESGSWTERFGNWFKNKKH